MSRLRLKSVNWAEHVHLVWLTGLFWAPLFNPGFGWLELTVTLASMAVFFWRYLRAHSGRPYPQGQRLISIGIFALMGLVIAPFNSWSSVYIIYAAGSAGYLRPTGLARRIIGGLTLVAVLYGLVLHGLGAPAVLAVGLTAMMSVLTLGIGYSNVQDAEQRRFNARLEAARAENERLAAIAERERIARDLHDLLGHTLSVITLKSELAAKLAERDPIKAKAEMLEVERISREATQQVREAVQGYKSRGWLAELAGAKLAFESAGIAFDYYADAVSLSPMQESVLSMSLREAVTNTLRHSNATRCAARLLKSEEGVRLEIEDNGKGGDFNAGSGLTGMRQRVEALGGNLEAHGTNGFRLSILLPAAASSSSAGLGELKPQTS